MDVSSQGGSLVEEYYRRSVFSLVRMRGVYEEIS